MQNLRKKVRNSKKKIFQNADPKTQTAAPKYTQHRFRKLSAPPSQIHTADHHRIPQQITEQIRTHNKSEYYYNTSDLE
ncbi:hypothetical protein LguiA_029920 [Lonicera macranthoides]